MDESNYLQSFTEGPLDAALRELAEQYHRRCESYDRTVCRFRNDRGIAIPSDAWEMARINRNASAVRQELWRIAQDIGATPHQWQRAIVKAAKYR